MSFSVSDAWETSVSLDTHAATSSAAKVLERHAAMNCYDVIMPPVSSVPSKSSKIEAMQRLAVQKGFFLHILVLVVGQVRSTAVARFFAFFGFCLFGELIPFEIISVKYRFHRSAVRNFFLT